VGCTAVVGEIDEDAFAAGASQRFGLPLASKRFVDQSLAVVLDMQIFDNGRTCVTKKKFGSGDDAIRLVIAE
jgi:hypothetical protein